MKARIVLKIRKNFINFQNENFNANINKNTFVDIFAQLRKNIFSNENSNFLPSYIYNVKEGSLNKYNQNHELQNNEFIIKFEDISAQNNEIYEYFIRFKNIHNNSVKDSNHITLKSY